MLDLHPARELAGADAEEGDAVAVGRIHVGLNLEGEAGEGLLVWRDYLEVYFLDFLISFSYEEIDGEHFLIGGGYEKVGRIDEQI
jgi:hypothetical protein